MNLNTGYKGKPHITAENEADLNRGVVGSGSYALSDVGMVFEAELVTNNCLKIKDGCGCMQGREVSIECGKSDEVIIENGTQGQKRIDLVVERYTKNADSGVEDTDTILIKGVPGSNPVAPQHIEGNIRAGDLIADWPLYEVHLDGINVVEVVPLFNVLMSSKEMQDKLAELNSKIEMYIITREDISINDAWKVLEYHCEKIGNMVFLNIEIFTSSYQANYKYENVLTIRNSDLKPVSNTPLNATGYDAGFGNGVACGCVIKDDGTMYVTIPQTGRGYVVINAAYRVV